MKTLILYASKYGAAKEIAKRIADKMGEAALWDLKQGNIPPLSDFDCVIIGSSVYAGGIHKEVKVFVSKNVDKLCEKPLGLFLSGFAEEGSYYEKNFPPKVVQAAKAKGFLGGIFDSKKANVFERFIIKIVIKKTDYVDSIDNEKIDVFVNEMKKF
ncbi:MAG: flavodoxin domain-containing protein [Defluviitaleaceae bacterium]|nr:flavodoxin domain-containing protein [Defluviitaleaceae bacterium]